MRSNVVCHASGLTQTGEVCAVWINASYLPADAFLVRRLSRQSRLMAPLSFGAAALVASGMVATAPVSVAAIAPMTRTAAAVHVPCAPISVENSVRLGPGSITAPSHGTSVFVYTMYHLKAGQTLLLEPGVYNIGYMLLRGIDRGLRGAANGTPTARITVASASCGSRAVIQGSLLATGLKYWTFTQLVFHATRLGKPALLMDGGVGWTLSFSEIFGAAQTGAFSNLAITGSGGTPRNFLVTQNCVHNAALSNRGNADHNIYVAYQGTAASGGVISRNTILNAPKGAGIKLGNGGVTGALGPWNVMVLANTFISNGRQVLLHGNIRGNKVIGNLLYRATAPFNSDPRTTQVYVNGRLGAGNTIANNYAFSSSMFTFDPNRSVAYAHDPLYTAPAYNPAFRGATCNTFVPMNPKATPYGRYGKIS